MLGAATSGVRAVVVASVLPVLRSGLVSRLSESQPGSELPLATAASPALTRYKTFVAAVAGRPSR